MVFDVYASTCDCNIIFIAHINFVTCFVFANLVDGCYSLWFWGPFLHACKRSGCHLVAIVGDFAIFKAIMAPLGDDNPMVTCGSAPHTTNLADDEEPIWKVAKRPCINK